MNRDGSNRAAADQSSDDRRHADLVADRHAAGVHLRPHRQRRRSTSSTPTARGLQQITRESACDRPTWSPAPLNEIAYASRVGGGNIIKIFDFANRNTRALTDAIGNNESPAFSPNGRHVAFVSTRAGKEQIFTIHRDGIGTAADHPDGNESLSELVEVGFRSRFTGNQASRGAIELTMTTHRQHILCAVVVTLARVGGVRQEEAGAAHRPADAAAASPRPTRTGRPRRRRRSPSRGRCRPSRSPRIRSPARDIGDINKNSPFQPVFFALDSSDVDGTAQQALNANAEILKKYPTWVITIEGHSDERGTAEYNLALGERRAMSARTYLVSLGHLRRSAADGQLRQGVPVRSGPRRGGLGEEPAGAVRAYEQVGIGARRGELTMRRMSAAAVILAGGVC